MSLRVCPIADLPGRQSGAVLLEVVLALMLFVAAATILTSGMSSSLDGVTRLRLQAHAADLAVSVASELQMGLKTADQGGAQPFPAPLEDWTWEVVAAPLQSESDEVSRFKKIEVIVRHNDPAVVYRLGQWLQLGVSTNTAALPGVSGF
jgi:hypothetical protein